MIVDLPVIVGSGLRLGNAVLFFCAAELDALLWVIKMATGRFNRRRAVRWGDRNLIRGGGAAFNERADKIGTRRWDIAPVPSPRQRTNLAMKRRNRPPLPRYSLPVIRSAWCRR
ncbi:hypothetical protein KCP74_25230 [Salmonella enterica subsp. enterica]|nr:hypothetical protein KCP74_25230 [Salmonella enterica subsp. enterica]